MNEPDLPHNFSTSVVDVVNDHRASLAALVLLLCDKGILTEEEFLSKKAAVMAVQDQTKAEVDEQRAAEMGCGNKALTDFFRGFFSR